MNLLRLWLHMLAMVLWPPLLKRWADAMHEREVATSTMVADLRNRIRNREAEGTALDMVIDQIENTDRERAEGLVACLPFLPCGCDESLWLRRRMYEVAGRTPPALNVQSTHPFDVTHQLNRVLVDIERIDFEHDHYEPGRFVEWLPCGCDESLWLRRRLYEVAGRNMPVETDDDEPTAA